MSEISELFIKPEVPVSVRIPDELATLAEERCVSVSKAIKLAVYALMEADAAGEYDLPEMSGSVKHTRSRRMTIRIPLAVHDRLAEAVAPRPVSAALAAIAALFLDNVSMLDHV